MAQESEPRDMVGAPITVGCELIWVSSQGGFLRQGRVTRIEPNRGYDRFYNPWVVWLRDPKKEKESETKAIGPRAFVVRSAKALP